MNTIINTFAYRIRNASNHLDSKFIIAFFFDPEFNTIYAVQYFEQEIEDENGSYIDSGHAIYSFTKNEKGEYLLKLEETFVELKDWQNYVRSNFFGLEVYDPNSEKVITEQFKKFIENN